MVLSLLVATAAMAQDVGYNFDADTHFEKFKTYKWVEIKDSQKSDELKDKEIKGVLDGALAKKRLTKTDADSANLYIGYQAGVAAEKQFASYNPDCGYGTGWYREGWWGGLYGKSEGQTSIIHSGQLAVDMYDPKQHCLVWRGVLSKALAPPATPEQQKKNLSKSLAKLLKKYPPPPLYSLSE